MTPDRSPYVQKLWGKISEDLEAGSYAMDIFNGKLLFPNPPEMHEEIDFDVSELEAQKYFILKSGNGLGGKNRLLSFCYLLAGGVSLAVSAFYIIFYKYLKNKG
jgi:LEM3 (ligand-effect modulator 3) family / CDC50 family